MESAQNKELARWVNQPVLQKLRLEMMSLPSKSVIKTEDEVKADDAAAAQQGPPPAMLEIQLKARKIALEEAQLAFQSKQQMQIAQWQHEEKIRADEARLIEAQARVAVSENQKEMEILKLMQKDGEASKRIMAQSQINRENNQTTTFLTSLEETRKRQENDLYGRELDLKERTGSGI